MLKRKIQLTMGELMSKKRMMPKAVRIYYEQMKKERLIKELAEYARQKRDYESANQNVHNVRE
jgi:hypothetical protein